MKFVKGLLLLSKAALLLVTVTLPSTGFGQTEWIQPWEIIGDSTLKSEAEKVILTGTVRDVATKLPVSGAVISVNDLRYFDQTDENGRYFLEIPRGRYRIRIRHLGMKPVLRRVKIFERGVINAEMEEGAIDLEEIVITARLSDANIKESLAGLAKFNLSEFKTLPTFFGEVDVIKSLQMLPGVSSVGEGTSGFNVRGGRVDQNLVLLDGAPLFNASHALGFISTFNPDVIQNFSLYKGNVPAYLGGRASSVLEVETKKGNFEKWKYRGGVGPATSRFTAEGPLVNNKTSLLVSGRVSYSNWIVKQVSNADVRNSSLFFYDANAILSHKFSENSLLQLSYYRSHDYFRFSRQFGYNWDNQLLNLKWKSMTNRKVSPILSAVYGGFKNRLEDPSGTNASTLTNALNYFHVKEAINYAPHENHSIVGGAETTLYLAQPEKFMPYGTNTTSVPNQVQKNKGYEWAFFLDDDFEISQGLSISAGLRFSAYTQIGRDTIYQYQENRPRSTATVTDTLVYRSGQSITSFHGLEPRLSLRINTVENQSVKVSYNRMRQYIHLISNTTAPTPVDLWQVATALLPPQIADNFSLGYFWNFKNNEWETSAEAFYKSMKNLVEYKNFPQLYQNKHLETELLSGIGKAYGAEFFIRRLKGRLTGWISYTYSRSFVRVKSSYESNQINNGNWYPSNFDKPHNVNLVLNKRINRKVSYSFLFNYTTGRPITAIESSYIVDGVVVPVYSERNQYRIPDYFRVDFSFTINHIFRKMDDALSFSIYNMLGRQNAYAVFYQRPEPIYAIPKPFKLSVLGSAFPSFTYNFNF